MRSAHDHQGSRQARGLRSGAVGSGMRGGAGLAASTRQCIEAQQLVDTQISTSRGDDEEDEDVEDGDVVDSEEGQEPSDEADSDDQ